MAAIHCRKRSFYAFFSQLNQACLKNQEVCFFPYTAFSYQFLRFLQGQRLLYAYTVYCDRFSGKPVIKVWFIKKKAQSFVSRVSLKKLSRGVCEFSSIELRRFQHQQGSRLVPLLVLFYQGEFHFALKNGHGSFVCCLWTN